MGRYNGIFGDICALSRPIFLFLSLPCYFVEFYLFVRNIPTEEGGRMGELIWRRGLKVCLSTTHLCILLWIWYTKKNYIYQLEDSNAVSVIIFLDRVIK